MQELQVFNYESKEIRTVDVNGEIFWVAKDVCDVLGYANNRKAIADHCKGVTNSYTLETEGGKQDLSIINEPNLYRLIIKSSLPEAEKFENWIFTEVLPSIRKTGQYSLAKSDSGIEKQLEEIKNILAAKKSPDKPMNLEQIKSLFKIIESDDERESILVEYGEKMFSIERNSQSFKLSYLNMCDKDKIGNYWRHEKSGLYSMKKALEYVLEYF